ncbi:slipin family protein [Larkinella rosea]|uniref:Slipin family protein n=1 Tax=Larkinella rosea TaxID=2025312 RepID=A0A3P1C1S4_9BACT|nr:slipin family protein [Larkinella rosea]RRB07189.1 slipin family protein [Larkinella rosea]
MKMVRVLARQVGLVFKHDAFKRVLLEGKHWIWPGETVSVFVQGTPVPSVPYDLSVLLEQPEIAALIDVVEVKDNEIALQYERGLFQTVLTKGRWAYWKGVKQFEYMKADISQLDIPVNIDLVTLMPQHLSAFVRTHTVEAHEKGVLFIDWNFSRLLSAGTYYWWKNNTPVHVAKVDTRQQQMEVSGQEMLTKDKASLRLSFFAQYLIVDVVKALVENREYEKQLYVLVQLALREYVGGLTLDELLDKKSEVAPSILQLIAEKADRLGAELRTGGVRDIILPGDMRDILNQVLMAEKKAQANSIMRREETASTRSLLNTAKLMEDNEMLWKLKEMEYVEKIADKIQTISVSSDGSMVDQLKQLFVRGRTRNS